MIEFTFNAFFALLTLHVEATRSNWSDTLPRNFPILFLSGQEDPIGEYGKGINKTIHSLERSGFKNVTSYIYPSLRHEILNEKENKKVYKDITNWLNKNQ